MQRYAQLIFIRHKSFAIFTLCRILCLGPPYRKWFRSENYVNQQNDSFFTHDFIAIIIIGTRTSIFKALTSIFIYGRYFLFFFCFLRSIFRFILLFFAVDVDVVVIFLFYGLAAPKNDCFDNEQSVSKQTVAPLRKKAIQQWRNGTERNKMYLREMGAHNIIKNFVCLRAFFCIPCGLTLSLSHTLSRSLQTIYTLAKAHEFICTN